MPYGKLVDPHHVARVPMTLRLDSAGGISSDNNCVPNVNMIDHSSVNCKRNKWFNSKRIGLGNMLHNKLQGLGGNDIMDDKCKVIKELLNRQFVDNSYQMGSNSKKTNFCPLAEHRANIMNSNIPTFHPAIVASTFGSCVPSSTLSYIPKMSYCNFNRCYQGKFKQKYFNRISCNSSSANQKKHFNKHPQKQCDKDTMEATPPEQKNADSSQSLTQTVQSTTSPTNCDKKNGSETTNFSIKQHNEEKCDIFDNNRISDSEVVSNWSDLCTDDESEDLKIHDVPVSWEEEVDDAVKNSDHSDGKCHKKMSDKVFHDANNTNENVEHEHKQTGHGQAKTLHAEEKNIPHIQIRINSLRPSEVKSENKSATEDKSFVLFVRKENKKCRPSVKKRRRSKAKKTDDDAEECQTQRSQNKSSPKCQNSAVAFMFGLNKATDHSEFPTHSFYMTFEDEHDFSDFSDDEESDECDDGTWSDTDSFCSEFASPLNLNLICSVKQHEDDTFSKQLKDINLAWQIQINRTSSSSSLNNEASNPKKNKKV